MHKLELSTYYPTCFLKVETSTSVWIQSQSSRLLLIFAITWRLTLFTFSQNFKIKITSYRKLSIQLTQPTPPSVTPLSFNISVSDAQSSILDWKFTKKKIVKIWQHKKFQTVAIQFNKYQDWQSSNDIWWRYIGG